MLICSAPDAQLAVAIATPAPEGAAGRSSARVLVSRSDSSDGVACRVTETGLLSIDQGYPDRQTENHANLCVHDAKILSMSNRSKSCEACGGPVRRRFLLVLISHSRS